MQIVKDRAIPRSAEHAPVSASPQCAPLVLIVEDEPELAELLDYNLRRHGYRTEIAGDGLSACRRIGAARPDLILLDLMLPDLDGREICAMVRSHPDPETAPTPIIMLTALGTLEDRVRGVEAGADIYLSKPYSVREVLLQTERLIGRRRAQRETEAALGRLERTGNHEEQWRQMLFHELRNQLLVISGYSNRLADKEPAPELAREYAQAIQRGADYLSRLAEEFLLLRRVESDQQDLPAEPVNPLWLVEDVVGLYRPLAAREGQQLALRTLGTPTPFATHPGALRLILSSLLENAVKYGKLGGNIEVELIFAAEELRITVVDDGPGIHPEEIERIFEKFYRGTQQSGHSAGHGLGLYSARTLARALGGELHATNRPEGGAEFTLSLPASDQGSQPR
ncbi:hybrid sensor histidine kinase/response regulator [Desulfuromonas acetexigens]|uniref:histidine kinase n=1 Tax=Trichloromonas acetexigens TaxID=38815 RepID=A0A550JBF1_9BACT|nr:hybrid sensor histidine kinase/response regulator [Desulfuromonas acetexigens]TRO80576.1 response regulator [Desulfuromonas acetexigens]